MSDFNPTAAASLLSPAELRELRAVVASNGGGVSTEALNARRLKIVMRLHMMGLVQGILVQGMSGWPSRVVHTREGLAVARAAKKEPCHD
jgi:hypothetical protein